MSDQFGMPLVDHRPSHEVIAELRDQLTAAQAREAELMADNVRLREAIDDMLCRNPTEPTTVKIAEALAATPAQSLARYHNEVLEKAAKKCDREPRRFLSDYEQGCEDMANCLADEIRAMKEQE